MTPQQMRKMTALGEQGTLDEKHWYRLVNGMSAGGEERPFTDPRHLDLLQSVSSGGICSTRSVTFGAPVAPAELRQRQEMIMRNQMAMAPQILTQGQQRLQGVPAQFEPRFMERSVHEFPLNPEA